MAAQWSLILFTVISGAGAWLFAWSMIQALAKKGAMPTKIETVVSAVLLAVGGIASATHLKHIDRIFEALNHPTSGIFVEAALIGVLVVLMVIYFVMLVRGTKEGGLKAVGVITAVVAIVFPFMCGYSYMMEAREAWMTIALPLAYWGTAAVIGAGCNIVTKALEKADDAAVAFAGILTVVAGVLAIVTSAAFFMYAAGWIEGADGSTVAWMVVTIVAGAVALACGAWAWKSAKNGMVAGIVAAIAGVVCAIGMRLAMWYVGTALLDFFLMPLD